MAIHYEHSRTTLSCGTFLLPGTRGRMERVATKMLEVAIRVRFPANCIGAAKFLPAHNTVVFKQQPVNVCNPCKGISMSWTHDSQKAPFGLVMRKQNESPYRVSCKCPTLMLLTYVRK